MIDRADNIRRLKQAAREPKTEKARKGIAQISEKRKERMKADKELIQSDKDFYIGIWNSAPHKCYECHISLGKVPSNFMFHHLLPKSIRGDLRHVPENIALVCLECHSKAETNIDTVPRIKRMKEEVEKLFPL